jgi:hypothetical protein
MEHHLTRKCKLKNNGPLVKVALNMGQSCEWRVQLQWRAERVGFIKSWSEFATRADLRVDDTIVFTLRTMTSRSTSLGRTLPAPASSGAGSITRALMLILAIKVLCLFSVYAAVKLLVVVLASGGCTLNTYFWTWVVCHQV